VSALRGIKFKEQEIAQKRDEQAVKKKGALSKRQVWRIKAKRPRDSRAPKSISVQPKREDFHLGWEVEAKGKGLEARKSKRPVRGKNEPSRSKIKKNEPGGNRVVRKGARVNLKTNDVSVESKKQEKEKPRVMVGPRGFLPLTPEKEEGAGDLPRFRNNGGRVKEIKLKTPWPLGVREWGREKRKGNNPLWIGGGSQGIHRGGQNSRQTW